MDTEELMDMALEVMDHLRNGPEDQAQELMCAQIYALLAIANELKKANEESSIQYSKVKADI